MHFFPRVNRGKKQIEESTTTTTHSRCKKTMTAVGRNWGLLQVRNLLIRGALIPIWKPSSTHTSNDVVQRIKGELRRNVERLKEAALPTERKFSIPRISVGHGGTLDPFASGVIGMINPCSIIKISPQESDRCFISFKVLGLTQGCKRLSHFLHCDKEYLVTATLGMATDTYDRFDPLSHLSTTRSHPYLCLQDGPSSERGSVATYHES